MSKGTAGRVQYRLRPAKNIERKMLCDTFARLERLGPLREYQYVGFGSMEFHDFALFYRRLGIKHMVSIEKRLALKERFKINRPHGQIRMEWGPSRERLPHISWRRPSIVWLDYDDPVGTDILDDVEFVASNVQSGSMLIVTVTAHPREADTDGKIAELRLADLRARVGRQMIPSGVAGKDLANWGLAEVSRQIISNEIARTLADRSASGQPMKYQQLLYFQYADGVKMMSTGGLLLSEDDLERMPPTAFNDLKFIRFADTPCNILVPRLTLREVRYLQQRMPHPLTNLKTVPSEDVERYRSVHRYFPSFTEVESY